MDSKSQFLVARQKLSCKVIARAGANYYHNLFTTGLSKYGESMKVSVLWRVVRFVF